MDAIHDLVQRLSQRVAPDEAEIAPDLLDGFLAGERSDPAVAPVLGGFDAGSALSIVLELLGALRANAAAISGLLALAGTALTTIDKLLDLRDRLGRGRAPADAAPDDPLRGALDILDALEKRLTAAGVPAERAPELGRVTLQTLLERPDDSRRLLAALAAAKG